ncbi:hypothetical protein AVEN_256055-1 [Araneus ventricosus]|uniref:Uncharacterized protein n=1 Tax=Araneus ventricosus TaxID=182803 RepID=A0A4Y2LP27_ARAVE|nr:hypothetical protein AVEN_256055-1 [Araneus ventricosus]
MTRNTFELSFYSSDFYVTSLQSTSTGMIGSVLLKFTPRLEIKDENSGLFCYGSSNLKPWSDDEDDIWTDSSSSNFYTIPAGGRLTCTRPMAK